VREDRKRVREDRKEKSETERNGEEKKRRTREGTGRPQLMYMGRIFLMGRWSTVKSTYINSPFEEDKNLP